MSENLQKIEISSVVSPKPLWRKWLIRCLWITPVIYLLFFTSFWAFWYVTIVWPISGARDFSASPWCKPGDFVLNILQPMVSDARMIEHFEKNKVEMEQMARLAMYGGTRKDDDDLDKVVKRPNYDHVSVLKKIEIKTVVSSGPWYTNPYELDRVKQLKQCRSAQQNGESYKRMNAQQKEEAIKLACYSQPQLWTVELTPAFGRTSGETACHRMASKHYRYFPSTPPKIENAKLMGPIEFDESSKVLGAIVSNTDWSMNGENRLLRKINDHWFIER